VGLQRDRQRESLFDELLNCELPVSCSIRSAVARITVRRLPVGNAAGESANGSIFSLPELIFGSLRSVRLRDLQNFSAFALIVRRVH
jgi:hypothetical protein